MDPNSNIKNRMTAAQGILFVTLLFMVNHKGSFLMFCAVKLETIRKIAIR